MEAMARFDEPVGLERKRQETLLQVCLLPSVDLLDRDGAAIHRRYEVHVHAEIAEDEQSFLGPCIAERLEREADGTPLPLLTPRDSDLERPRGQCLRRI